MNRKELYKELRRHGWEVTIDSIDFRRQSPELWYDYDIIFEIRRGKHVIQIVVTGEIRIYSKHRHFIYKGGKPDGELTYYLRKYGEWGNNNWFEINEDGSSYRNFEEAYYTLNEAVENLLKKITDEKVEVHLPDYTIGDEKYRIVYEKQIDKYTADVHFGEECDTEEECKEILRKKGIHEYYLVYYLGKWIEKKKSVEGGEE